MSIQAKAPAGERVQSQDQLRGSSVKYDSTPDTVRVNPDVIPAELKAYPHWVVYRLKWNPERGKYDKIPYNATTGRHASTSDPATWATFEQALTAYETDTSWSGLGYVFSPEDPFTGIDLDGAPDQDEWIQRFDSYAERSPSGEGAHIIIRGALPTATGKKHGDYEAYSWGRFFTVTGHHIAGSPATINGQQAVLKQFLDEKFPAESPRNTAPAGTSHVDDDELIELIRRSKQGPKFERLWAGDTSEFKYNASDADGSLTMILAFWTNRDPAQMDRIFRRSGLMRDKWDDKRGEETYGSYSIRTAIEETTEGYIPSGGGAPFTLDSDAGNPACSALVAELEAKVERLQEALRTEREERKRKEAHWSRSWAIIRNKNIRPGEKIGMLATLYVIESASQDPSKFDEQSRIKTCRAAIADVGGVGVNTITRSVDRMAEWGMIEKDLVTVWKETRDPETGEAIERKQSEWRLFLNGSTHAVMETLATFEPPESTPRQGGARTPKRCPEHPDALLHKTTVETYHCEQCGTFVDETVTTTLVAPGEMSGDYLIQEDSTIQVEQLERTSPSVGSSTKGHQLEQLTRADSGSTTIQDEQQPRNISQQYRPERYVDEIPGRHLYMNGSKS